MYQWQDRTPIDGVINYTSQPLARSATTETTSYSVTGLTNGTTTTTSCVPWTRPPTSARVRVTRRDAHPSPRRVRRTPITVGWGKAATLSGTLGDGAEPFPEGSVVTVQSSVNGGATWADVGEYDLDGATRASAVTPTQKTQYRLVYAGDSVHRGGESPVVTVTPQGHARQAAVAPSAVKRGVKFTVYGSISPEAGRGARRSSASSATAEGRRVALHEDRERRQHDDRNAVLRQILSAEQGVVEARRELHARRPSTRRRPPAPSTSGSSRTRWPSGCRSARRRGRLRPVLVAAAAIVAVVLAAWALQAMASGGAGSSQDDPAPPYSVAVRQDGEVLKSYDLAALHALPQRRIVIDGKEQTGPSLATLLEDAGV